ncbi:MAG: DUF2304 domain-containing protein [Deltaproteobacteria bacterium]|nr:DUF2304 domain-containing protein [Deltaproteobacteria bacterium]
MQIIQIVSIGGSLLLLIAIVELIRRGMLKERYALLWLFSSVVILILSIWRKLLDRIAIWFGIAYPPSLLFLVAFLFLMLIILHFSVVVSNLSERNKVLAQDLALIRAKLDKMMGSEGRGKKHAEDERDA